MRSRWIMTLVILTSSLLFLAVGVLAWGDWRGFFAHPARTGVVLVNMAATVAALLTDVNMSAGRREGESDLWALGSAVLGVLVLAFLPPYMERRGMWTIDGDGARYLGLALAVLGSVLRVWPMFVLGRRFSGRVAIQEGHRLTTEGVYRVVRNPSYLGMMVYPVGWGLVFRSGLGLLFVILGIPLLVARIEAEERLLASEFGDAYAVYRRRTWRLLPWVY